MVDTTDLMDRWMNTWGSDAANCSGPDVKASTTCHGESWDAPNTGHVVSPEHRHGGDH